MKKIILLFVIFICLKSHGQISYAISSTSYVMYGLNTTTKPVNPPDNCLYIETNTGNTYFSSGGVWILPNKNKTIKSLSDFPAPVSGVITPQDSTTYIISGTVDIGNNRIVCGVKNSFIGLDRVNDKLLYTGTGTMFTMDGTATSKSNILFSNLTIGASNGTLLNVTSPSANQAIGMLDLTITNTATLGTVNNISTWAMTNIVIRSAVTTAGFTITGANGTIKCRLGVFSNNAGTTFNFGSSTEEVIDFNNNQISCSATQVFMNGTTGGANVTVTGKVNNNTYTGAGTFVSTIGMNDALWNFDGNLGTLNTATTVANGGTGAITNTGVLIGNGTSAVTAVAAGAASQYFRRNAGNTAYEFAPIPSGGDLLAANNLSDVLSASTSRGNLGLAIGTNVQAFSSNLLTIAGLTPTTNNFIVSVAGAWASLTPAQVKTTLAIANTDVSGLGTSSTQNTGTFLQTANNLSDVLSASTSRGNLGGSTIGQNIFTATNPGAIRYFKANADNTFSFRTAAEMLSDIGAQASGTYVLSVTGTANQIVSTGGNTPVLSLVSGGILPGAWALATPASGNLINCTFPILNQNTNGTAGSLSAILSTALGGTGVDNSTGGTANQFWARPNGTPGTATYRAIVAADIPTLNQNTSGSAGSVLNTLSIAPELIAGGATSYNGSVAKNLSIQSNSVINTMLSQITTATFKGRTTAGTGNVEDLTATQATALLNNFTGDSGAGGTKGLVTAPAAGDAAAGKFLKADGQWTVPPSGGGGQTFQQTFATALIRLF